MTSILKCPHHPLSLLQNKCHWLGKAQQERIPLILSCCRRQADVTLYKFKAFRGWGMPEPSSQTPVTTLNRKPSYRAALPSGQLAPNILQKQEQIQSLAHWEDPKKHIHMKPWLKAYTYTLQAHTEVRHPEKQLSTLTVKTQIWNVFLKCQEVGFSKEQELPLIPTCRFTKLPTFWLQMCRSRQDLFSVKLSHQLASVQVTLTWKELDLKNPDVLSQGTSSLSPSVFSFLVTQAGKAMWL